VVIWGHEHECQTQFVESLHGRFRVLQPGSTVATSLVDGEAALKHLAVLELREQQFRLITYRLRNVRPFLTDEVRLDDEDYGLDPEDAKVEASIDKLLEDTVTTLVQKARAERQEFLEEGPSGPPPNRLCVMQEPNQVLVRVKVDRLGFQTLNNQRFGARFVGEGKEGSPASETSLFLSSSLRVSVIILSIINMRHFFHSTDNFCPRSCILCVLYQWPIPRTCCSSTSAARLLKEQSRVQPAKERARVEAAVTRWQRPWGLAKTRFQWRTWCKKRFTNRIASCGSSRRTI